MNIIVICRKLIRVFVLKIRYFFLKNIYGMDISKSALISYRAKLDKTHPKGIHISDESYIASGAIVFSHDFSRDLKTDTFIGKKCFIGANAIIMPGIKIGDEVIVGAGSVVTKNVPSNCIVAGNPAKVLKTEISTEKYGQLLKNL